MTSYNHACWWPPELGYWAWHIWACLTPPSRWPAQMEISWQCLGCASCSTEHAAKPFWSSQLFEMPENGESVATSVPCMSAKALDTHSRLVQVPLNSSTTPAAALQGACHAGQSCMPEQYHDWQGTGQGSHDAHPAAPVRAGVPLELPTWASHHEAPCSLARAVTMACWEICHSKFCKLRP